MTDSCSYPSSFSFVSFSRPTPVTPKTQSHYATHVGHELTTLLQPPKGWS